MRLALLALPLALCSCLATSGEIDRAIVDITSQFGIVAREAQESSDEARAAWERGEIDYAALEKKLADIRAATIGTAKETAETVLEGVKETIEERPEKVVAGATNVIGGMFPGPTGEIILYGGGLIATYIAARRKAREDAEAAKVAAKRDAEDAVWDFKMERTQEHLAKAEAKAEAKK